MRNMRKFIAVFIAAALLVSILGLTMTAEAAQRQKKANVSYGTPTIDGIMDDCYKNSDEIVIQYPASIANNAEEGMEHAIGRLWMCWDESYIYMYLDVLDKTPVTQPLENFGSDAFESVFDFDNNNSDDTNSAESYWPNGIFVKTLAYARTVGTPEFEIDWVAGMGTDHQDWFINLPESEHQVICVIKPDGYIIERRVPVNDAVKAMFKPGYSFGFQIWLLDDIDDNNQRDFKLSWGEPTAEIEVTSWGQSAVCDELTLIAAPPPPPEPDPEPDAPIAAGGGDEAPEPPPVQRPTAPTTGDAGIVLIIALLAAGAAGILLAKKIKN